MRRARPRARRRSLRLDTAFPRRAWERETRTPARGTIAPGRRARGLRRPAVRPRRPISVHRDPTTLVRSAQHPAVLRRRRAGHRAHGHDPGGPPGAAIAPAARAGRSVRAWRSGSARTLRRARTRSASSRAPLTRWPGGSRRCSRPSAGCFWTSRTSSARRSHGSTSPSIWPAPATTRANTSERIQRDISRLSVLVNELLQLTRAEGDPQSHQVELVSLDDLVECVVEDCAMEADARGCSLRSSSHQECGVMGEPELLRRAIENVVRNAIAHAPEGSTVQVSLVRGTDTATITVRDRGTGVPEELLYAIFEPFFRVEGDRARATGGVGLGLAIARRAIDLHHGKISARNASPGLVVTIELPLAAPAAVAT